MTLPPSADFDERFDALLPEPYRAVSAVHFTPASICLRAAKLIAAVDGERVLDVGSGVGKFCITAALHGPGHFEGVEQRPQLVQIAKALAKILRARNTAFTQGDALDAAWSSYDALYFFNPFFEMRFAEGDGLGELQTEARADAAARAAEKLRELKSGTRVVIYCELGAPMPSSFSLLSESFVAAGWLRLFVQR